jgi:hypothetical protein
MFVLTDGVRDVVDLTDDLERPESVRRGGGNICRCVGGTMTKPSAVDEPVEEGVSGRIQECQSHFRQ